MKQKLDGIGASHAANLMPHADSTTSVSARNGIALNLVMEYGARAGEPVGVAGNSELAVVQALKDLRKLSLHGYRVLGLGFHFCLQRS